MCPLFQTPYLGPELGIVCPKVSSFHAGAGGQWCPHFMQGPGVKGVLISCRGRESKMYYIAKYSISFGSSEMHVSIYIRGLGSGIYRNSEVRGSRYIMYVLP